MAARREHVFLVRMWSEGPRRGQSSWRGSVRHIATGRTLFIAAPGEVADFITMRLVDHEPATTRSDPESEH